MGGSVRFLVVDGYKKSAREVLTDGGASMAGDLYAKMLKRCLPGAEIDLVFPADPDSGLPQGVALSDYDGIAWTGSSLTIFHDVPEVRAQIAFCRAAFQAQVPSFGSCWAVQVAAVAAGGRCAAHPGGREIGIARKIALTPEGRGHPMYAGKASVFDGFISHDDEVTHLPPGAQVLASNPWSRVQALGVAHAGGAFWSVQYHPEYDLHELARLIWVRLDKLIGFGFFADRDQGERHVALLDTLHQDPARKDIAWMLGIDSDVLDPDIRQLEVRNWIERLVLPNRHR